VKVRLTGKLADVIDGIDLGQCHVGDIVDLPPREASLLLAEAWAVPEQGIERPVRAYRPRTADTQPAATHLTAVGHAFAEKHENCV
jgi:hypothetical protein